MPLVLPPISSVYQGDREETALIFTSGSSGEPKGVIFPRNLLGNVEQISDINLLDAHRLFWATFPVSARLPQLYGIPSSKDSASHSPLPLSS